jgi:hypothetical protein
MSMSTQQPMPQQRTPCHGRSNDQKRWWSVRSEGVLEFLAEDVVWYTVHEDTIDSGTSTVQSVDPDGGPYVHVGGLVTLLDGTAYRILAITSIAKLNVRSNPDYDEDEYDLHVLCDVKGCES